MKRIKNNVKNEFLKIGAMTKYRLFPILFVALLIIVTVVSNIPGNVVGLTLANFPFTVLSWLGYLIAPIAAFMLASDLLAGEVETGQIRIALARPLSRIKILFSKLVAIIGYLMVLYLLGFVTSSTISIAFTGLSGFSIMSAISAYALGILPVLVLAAMAIMVATSVKSSTSGFALCLCLYTGAMLLGWVFPSFSPMLFTSYMGIGSMVIGTSIPIVSLLTGIGILLGYSAMFLSVGSLRFEYKEL